MMSEFVYWNVHQQAFNAMFGAAHMQVPAIILRRKAQAQSIDENGNCTVLLCAEHDKYCTPSEEGRLHVLAAGSWSFFQ